MQQKIQAGQFKAHCLQIMSEVNQTKKTYLVTKHHTPFVKIVPVDPEIPSIFGYMKGTIHVLGDIIQPIDVEWDASR